MSDHILFAVITLCTSLVTLSLMFLQIIFLFLFRSRISALEEALKKRTAEKDLPPVPRVSAALPKREELKKVVPNIPCVTKPSSGVIPIVKEEKKTAEKKESLWNNFLQWLYVGHSSKEVSREYAIATTWLIRTGILIVLCGVGFFLKYSIERDLAAPQVRIGSTWIIAIILFALGLKGLNKRFHLLATGLLSIGTISFYMGTFAGFRFYHLYPVWAAFLLMIFASAFSMSISAKYKLLPLALTGCIGGYFVPVLLSRSSGNITFLAIFLLIISAGILITARFHFWRSLECTGFIFSFLLLLTGVFSYPEKVNYYTLCPLFLLFAEYLCILLIRKKEHSFTLAEWLLPAGSTFFTMIAGVYIIHSCAPMPYRNIFSAAFVLLLGVSSYSAGAVLRKIRQDGKKVFPSFLASAIFALFLTIPLSVKDQGIWICCWSILGAVLVFACRKTQEKIPLYFALFSFGSAFLFLLIRSEMLFPAHFLTRFFQLGVFALALIVSGFFLWKKKSEICREEFTIFRNFFFLAGSSAFFLYSSYEVYTFCKNTVFLKEFRNGGLSVWWAFAGILLLTAGIMKKIKSLRKGALILFLLAFMKACIIDTATFNTLQKVIAFLILGVFFLGGAFAYILMKKYFLPEREK